MSERSTNKHAGRLALSLSLAGLLATGSAVLAQNQPAPATTTAAQKPAATRAPAAATPAAQQPQAAASKWHLPFFGGKPAANGAASGNGTATANGAAAAPASSNPVKHFFDSFTNRGAKAAPATGNGASGAAGSPGNAGNPATGTAGRTGGSAGAPAAGRSAGAPGTSGSAPRHAATGSGGSAALPAHTTDNRVRLASLNSDQAVSARSVQSQTFLGHAAPAGSHELQQPDGSIVRKASDGSTLELRNPKNGLSIQHGLDGSRRVTVDQPDGSRVFAPSHGLAYVQHPYLFHAQPFDHRTLVQQGHLTHQFYRPYTYAGVTMDAYAPQHYYSPDVYRWAATRYAQPVQPQWNFVNTPTPWYSYYKGYFTPETSYSSPVGWLTDFVLATSLISAYNTHPPAAGAAPVQPDATPVISPEVKEKVSDEVARQVHRESLEADENAQNKDPSPGAGGVVQELSDREPHVFVVSSDLDLVDPSGRRCMVSEGDVVQVISGPKAKTGTATTVVLASKGGVECERAAQVEVALADLQEMQNHMRETIDQGMANTSVGAKAPTVTPAFAAAAPPPDPNAGKEIEQQKAIAAAADG
jgi:hypothetical protein